MSINVSTNPKNENPNLIASLDNDPIHEQAVAFQIFTDGSKLENKSAGL